MEGSRPLDAAGRSNEVGGVQHEGVRLGPTEAALSRQSHLHESNTGVFE